jgi:hypothetical protein
MSFKTSIVKKAIKWTPKKIIKWVANFKLKGIAEVSDFRFDLDARTVYAQVQLFGEAEPLEVWLEDFAVLSDEDSYRFILQQAKSNRPWLDNVFARFVGKAWKIPMLPQLAPHVGLLAELLKAKAAEPENQ